MSKTRVNPAVAIDLLHSSDAASNISEILGDVVDELHSIVPQTGKGAALDRVRKSIGTVSTISKAVSEATKRGASAVGTCEVIHAHKKRLSDEASRRQINGETTSMKREPLAELTSCPLLNKPDESAKKKLKLPRKATKNAKENSAKPVPPPNNGVMYMPAEVAKIVYEYKGNKDTLVKSLIKLKRVGAGRTQVMEYVKRYKNAVNNSQGIGIAVGISDIPPVWGKRGPRPLVTASEIDERRKQDTQGGRAWVKADAELFLQDKLKAKFDAKNLDTSTKANQRSLQPGRRLIKSTLLTAATAPDVTVAGAVAERPERRITAGASWRSAITHAMGHTAVSVRVGAPPSGQVGLQTDLSRKVSSALGGVSTCSIPQSMLINYDDTTFAASTVTDSQDGLEWAIVDKSVDTSVHSSWTAGVSTPKNFLSVRSTVCMSASGAR